MATLFREIVKAEFDRIHAIDKNFHFKFDDELNEAKNFPLTETLTYTVPVDLAIEKIKYHFSIEDNTIYNPKGTELIMVLMFDCERNIKLMSKCMNFFGYYLGRKTNQTEGDLTWFQYEPKFKTNCDEEVREGKILYHITPTYNVEKILKNGFSPRHKNKIYSYDSRVYFNSSKLTLDGLKKNASILSKFNKSKGNNGSYSVLTIDVTKISKETHFYKDDNYKEGYYTKDNIPPNCIIDILNLN